MDEYIFDIMFVLNKSEKTFNDLKDLNMSPTTILSKLREAQSKGWVKDELIRKEGKKPRIAYILTKEGKEVFEAYSSILPQYNELREEIEKLQKEVKEREKNVRYLLSTIKT